MTSPAKPFISPAWPSRGEGSGPSTSRVALPPLRDGDRLDQREFHRRYQAMPPRMRFELVGGIVHHMASPVSNRHGSVMLALNTVVGLYKEATPGAAAACDATTILSPHDEVQPDISLRLLPEYGGRAYVDETGRIVNAPELVIEISQSTESYDLGPKKRAYQQAGVQEYWVVGLASERVRVFDLPNDQEWTISADGTFRSRVFPGFWIHAAAALEEDQRVLNPAARQGLASPEHAAFIRQLEGRRRGQE